MLQVASYDMESRDAKYKTLLHESIKVLVDEDPSMKIKTPRSKFKFRAPVKQVKEDQPSLDKYSENSFDDSYVLGIDISAQTSINSEEEQNDLENSNIRSFMGTITEEGPVPSSSGSGNIETNQPSNVEQVSKTVQTSSSTSLQFMQYSPFSRHANLETVILKSKSSDAPKPTQSEEEIVDLNAASGDKEPITVVQSHEKQACCMKRRKRRKEQKVYTDTSSEATVASRGEVVFYRDYLKVHPNGRYIDEALDFYQQDHPKYENIPRRERSPSIGKKYNDLAISADISLNSYDKTHEIYSEGEVKCTCSTSIGEIHICKYAHSIKSKVQYLKKNPNKLMQYEFANPNVKVIKQRALNDNWHTYYISSNSSSP